MNEQEKFNLRLTFFLGLGFFTNMLVWTLFFAQVPITLFEYLGSYGLVGLWISMFNVIAIIMVPVFSSISDNTRSKYGRRMPYLMVGIPISAIIFVLISTINPKNPNTDPLWLLLLYIFFFNVVMSSFRGQTIALMPDFTKPVHRSKGYAIFNFMAGLGTIIAYTVNYLLVPISVFLAFFTIAVIMIFSLLIMMITVKEKNSYSYQQILELKNEVGKKIKRLESPFQSIIESFKYILTSKDKSALAILLAIFLWSCGLSALRALFSVYATDVLNMERGFAGTMLLFYAIPFFLMTIPSGIIATKIGRRLTIKIGLISLFFGMIIGYLFQNPTMIIIGLIIAGAGFALVNINAVVILWDLVPSKTKAGTYTGIYFLVIFLGGLFGPVIVGFAVDFFGNAIFLLIISIFIIASLICIFFVKSGETDPSINN